MWAAHPTHTAMGNGGSSPGDQGGLCGAECPPAEPENQTKVDKKEQECHSGRGTAWAEGP